MSTDTPKFERTALLILDGWGIGTDPKADAIAAANTPFFDKIQAQYPHSQLTTHGLEVGLPEGQMGNSEVGHLNIGAGRVVYQELARIHKAVKDGEIKENPIFQQLLADAQKSGRLHLMGLVSDGGVHSHIEHLLHLIDLATEIPQVFVHAFMDGRDCDPQSGAQFLQTLQAHITTRPNTQLASLIGRYYAMDRDKRWERIKLAYDLLIEGKGAPTSEPLEALQASYAAGITDEFIAPMVCVDAQGKPLGCIGEGDTVFCFNFRTDRCRQLTQALTQTNFADFGMQRLPLRYYTMTRYDETYTDVGVIFEKDELRLTMGEVLAKAGKTQLRVAETEKYPHVSFFFSGGKESLFEGEERIMIPSPKVATYDLQPEMSAQGITEAVLTRLQADSVPDFICLNYANADMVGHTGVWEAAIKAAETVDGCLSQLVPALLAQEYAIIIIADHGNSDCMRNADGSPNTAHTTNPVPCLLLTPQAINGKLSNGKLADLAPTLLHLMQIPAPKEMTGSVLLG